MNKPLKNFELLLIIPIVILTLIKFFNIVQVPIFLDEAIYLSQAEEVTEDIHNLFIAFQGTQFPIMTWILAVVNVTTHNFFNLLASGRVISVLSDLGSAYFIYLIGKKMLNQKYGLLASLVYLVLPLTFLHSRFVMLESMTNFFSLIAIYFIISTQEADKKINRFKTSLGIAAFIILAFFTKPLATVSFIAAFFAPFFFAMKEHQLNFRLKEVISSYKKVILGFLIAGIVILAIFLPLASHFTVHLNFAPTHQTNLMLDLKTNLLRSWLWTKAYITFPISLLILLSALYSLIRKEWRFVWLFVWIAIVVFLDSLFGKHFYPRHLYPMAAPVALLVGYGIYLSARLNRFLPIIFTVLVLILPLKTNYQLLFSPASAMIGEDRQQFFEDWSSGVGLSQVALKLNSLSKDKTIDVYLENEVLTAWALPNLFDIGNVRIHPSNELLFNRGSFYHYLVNQQADKEVYIVLNHYLDIPNDWNVELVESYPKGPNRSIVIYRYKGSNN